MVQDSPPQFSNEDVMIADDGRCVFVDTPVGTIQIGCYGDTPNDVDVIFEDHVNLGIQGEAKNRPTVEVSSREFPTNLVLKDIEGTFDVSRRGSVTETPTPSIKSVSEWHAKAGENIGEWGLQDRETLLLAMQEELGELTRAVLEEKHEDGSPSDVLDEMDDLGALLIQFATRVERGEDGDE